MKDLSSSGFLLCTTVSLSLNRALLFGSFPVGGIVLEGPEPALSVPVAPSALPVQRHSSHGMCAES